MDYNNTPTGYPPTQETQVVSLKEWIISILLLAIPIVNIIMLFIWAFGGGTNPSKSNFAKAYLIWAVIGIVLSILFMILFGATFAAMMSQSQRAGGY